MKILVAGSLRHLDGEPLEEARLACRQIGRALVEAGHELVVGSASPRTADYHALVGAGEAKARESGSQRGGSKARVRVVRPDNDRLDRFDPFCDDPRYDVRFEVAGRGWWTERRRQVGAADGVILVGGAGGTRSLATVAYALHRPVLPIPRFGGAAAEPDPQALGLEGRLTREERRRLSDGWDPGSPELAVRALTRLIGAVEPSRAPTIERHTSLPLWVEIKVRELAPRALGLIAALYSLTLFVAGVVASVYVERILP